MNATIQAAIEKAEEARKAMLGHGVDCGRKIPCWHNTVLEAAIRSLAALVREYGHVAGCECVKWNDVFEDGKRLFRREDPRCLPESREGKP